ncbi:hypothetical protein V5O48_017127 [Marasmius crinis-equi]
MLTRARSKATAPPPRTTQRKRPGTKAPKAKTTVAAASAKTPRSKGKGRTRKLKADVSTSERSSCMAPPDATHAPDAQTSIVGLAKEESRFTTPAPLRRVHFDVDTLTLTMAPQDDIPRGFAEIPTRIPGDWQRSPGGTSQRLIVVPEDTTPQAQHAREMERHVSINKIFQEQYDLLLAGGEEASRRHQEFLRENGGLMDGDAMEI